MLHVRTVMLMGLLAVNVACGVEAEVDPATETATETATSALASTDPLLQGCWRLPANGTTIKFDTSGTAKIVIPVPNTCFLKGMTIWSGVCNCNSGVYSGQRNRYGVSCSDRWMSGSITLNSTRTAYTEVLGDGTSSTWERVSCPL